LHHLATNETYTSLRSLTSPQTPLPPRSPPFPYTTLFRSIAERAVAVVVVEDAATYIGDVDVFPAVIVVVADAHTHAPSAMVQARDRKSTRLNSSHGSISYTVFAMQQNMGQATHTSRLIPS